MWWDKFSYPEWMLSRYVGEFWDAFYYWWIDDQKVDQLSNAMKNNKELPKVPIDMKYWPEYLVRNN
jgi:hypothetical protein